MKILLLGKGVANNGCKKLLDKHNIDYDYLNISELIKYQYDYIVSSPGISLFDDVFLKLKGIIISDIELCYMLEKKYMICVTGSNGKTSVVNMLNSIISKKYKTVACGNIGYSVCDAVCDNPDAEIFIVELSSFQLEKIRNFKANIFVILNISPTHLDHHHTMKHYVDSKLKGIMNLDKKGYCIYNKGNPFLKRLSKENNCNYISYNYNSILDDIYYLGEYIRYKNKKIMKIKKEDINKIYKIENYIAVLNVLLILKFNLVKAGKMLNEIKNVKYRFEMIRNNIYNDAKSTNCASTNAALLTLNNVLLICGGYDRGIDIFLDKEAKNNIKKVYCYGESKDKIYNYFISNNIKCYKFDNLKNAFMCCWKEFEEKDNILYSPMCASFDQYENYIKRGEEFDKLCKSIIIK